MHLITEQSSNFLILCWNRVHWLEPDGSNFGLDYLLEPKPCSNFGVRLFILTEFRFRFQLFLGWNLGESENLVPVCIPNHRSILKTYLAAFAIAMLYFEDFSCVYASL